MMKGPIEIAQVNTQTNDYAKKLNVGDKREWYWQDHTQKDQLIVRKTQIDEYLENSFSSSSGSPSSSSGGQ